MYRVLALIIVLTLASCRGNPENAQTQNVDYSSPVNESAYENAMDAAVENAGNEYAGADDNLLTNDVAMNADSEGWASSFDNQTAGNLLGEMRDASEGGSGANAVLESDDVSRNSQASTTNEDGAGVEKGQGAFIEPGDMELGSWYSLEFIIGPNEGAISDEAEALPLTPARPIFISSAMRVTLLDDPNFEFKPQSQALQLTGVDKTASWQWSVKPLRDGSHFLHAQVEVLKRNADGKYEVIEKYTRRVSVNVKVGTWEGLLNALRNAASLGDILSTLFGSWQKTLIALGLLIAAAFGVWRIIRSRGKGDGDS